MGLYLNYVNLEKEVGFLLLYGAQGAPRFGVFQLQNYIHNLMSQYWNFKRHFGMK